jgi:hypothetical protein
MLKKNIFDIIDDFYESDVDWTPILDYESAVGFMRRESFRGTNDETLRKVWTQIESLCFYLCTGYQMLGDMSPDDFIDSVAWCGRNLPSFTINEENVRFYLDACHRLLQYLHSQKLVTDDTAPLEAREKLLHGDTLRVLNPDGSYQEEYSYLDQHRTPDLSGSINWNDIGKTQRLEDEMMNYFTDDKFLPDMYRSTFLFFGIQKSFANVKEENTATESSDFWYFFLYDYKMIATGQTAVSYYRQRYVAKHPNPDVYTKETLALLDKLVQTRLIIFLLDYPVIIPEEDTDVLTVNDMWYCQDLATGEPLELRLPFDLPEDVSDMVFIGHLLPDGNMLADFVRSVKMGKVARSRAVELLAIMHNIYALQKPEAIDWKIFLQDNPALFLGVFLVNPAFFIGGANVQFDPAYTYKPSPIHSVYGEKACVEILGKMMHIPQRDQHLLLQIWADFYAAQVFKTQPLGPDTKSMVKDGLIWCLAILEVLCSLNRPEPFNVNSIADILECPEDLVQKRAHIVQDLLQIKHYDPRYLTEEGMLYLAQTDIPDTERFSSNILPK